MITREQLIAIFRDELKRQAEKQQPGTPYIYCDNGATAGIDGEVDLGELADRVLANLKLDADLGRNIGRIADRLRDER